MSASLPGEPAPVSRRVFTAEDVLRLVREGGREMVVGPDDRLTALARDTARERGVTIVVAPVGANTVGAPISGAHANPNAASRAAPPGWPAPQAGPTPTTAGTFAGEPRITHVAQVGRLGLDPFPADIGRPEMDVRLRDVVTGRDGLPIAAGVLSLRAGAFPWRLDYDEIEYVLEGELHITTATQRVVGLPGDVIAVPKGSSITFGTPSWAKFLYVTYPADWNPA
ncbi:MAG: cupin domain-containing protein [Tetrasphaera sp.]